MTEVMTATDGTGLASSYPRVRSLTEELAAPLSGEDQTVQSMPDVSPAKWHRAHTSWFFETFLLTESLGSYAPFDPAYEYLFNSYYEGVGPIYPREQRGLVSRPGIEEIARYRIHVDRAMEQLLTRPLDPRTHELVTLGLHHEQQHQELLLMDIKHVLWHNPVRRSYGNLTEPEPPGTALTPAEWVEHPGGLVEIGHQGPGFSFDNERPRHPVYLQPFALSDRVVTCSEWTSFIEDGGYQRADLWLSDGWAAVRHGRWDAPLYWTWEDGAWQVFTLGGVRPMHPHEPVCHVSYYEADAFARWSGARLPTEHEWEAVHSTGSGATDDTFDLARLHPCPLSPSDSGSVPGSGVWQWTSSSYSPYPGFTIAAGAVGEYNGKFMVNQYVLRGGSCVTPPGHARTTYRNFFPPGARWAFSGLRLARDA